MADTKISAETSAGALTGAEIVPVVRGTGSPPTYSNLRTTAQDIANLGGGGGSLSLISTLTASGSASLAWTGLTGRDYLLLVDGLTPATNAQDIYVQAGTGAGPTWLTSSGDYKWTSDFWVESTGGTGNENSATTVGITIGNAVDNSGGGQLGCAVMLFGLSLSQRHFITFSGMRMNGAVPAWRRGVGTFIGTTPKTAIRLIAASGNLASGTASLYRYVP